MALCFIYFTAGYERKVQHSGYYSTIISYKEPKSK